MRTIFLDYDARRNPKTRGYCAMCQRDIGVGASARVVRIRVSDMHILHPEDAGLEGDVGLLGHDCAKKIGLEWSVPE